MIGKILLFVRQAIIIAIIPATNLGFCGEIHIILSFTIRSGKIRADKTAGGTKFIALRSHPGKLNLPYRNINEKRKIKVPMPIIKMLIISSELLTI